MTAIRIGTMFLAVGIVLLIVGAFQEHNEDLFHIGGVGCVVFGAVAICVATEARNGNVQQPRQR